MFHLNIFIQIYQRWLGKTKLSLHQNIYLEGQIDLEWYDVSSKSSLFVVKSQMSKQDILHYVLYNVLFTVYIKGRLHKSFNRQWWRRQHLVDSLCCSIHYYICLMHAFVPQCQALPSALTWFHHTPHFSHLTYYFNSSFKSYLAGNRTKHYFIFFTFFFYLNMNSIILT